MPPTRPATVPTPSTARRLAAVCCLFIGLTLSGCGQSDVPNANAAAGNNAAPAGNQSATTTQAPSRPQTESQARSGETDGPVPVDPNLYDYKKIDGVSGRIASVGSDTMNNLMTLWVEGFKRHYPNVVEEIEGKGSSTAPRALIQRTADFGPMSRPMKASEQDEFKSKFGYEATQLPVAIDTVAVFVHKDNPIEGLSLQQIDAMFSKNRKGGHPSDITRWGDVGLAGQWSDLTISLFGRNSASGTYSFFKDVALYDGDYKDTVKEQPGSSAVVQGIARDRRGIGYSGIGYKTPDVRVLPISIGPDEPFVLPDGDTAMDGTYPLARPLLLSVNYEPNSSLDPLRREFIKFIFSKQGQQQVVKDGYYPVPARVARQALASVGIAWPGDVMD